MAQNKTAKQRHFDKILQYLTDWSNPWPNRDTMAGICGVKPATLRHHFAPEDFAEVESDVWSGLYSNAPQKVMSCFFSAFFTCPSLWGIPFSGS